MLVTPLAIRKLRKSLNERQAKFAVRFGVDQSTVSKWETGKQKPEGDNYLALKALIEESQRPQLPKEVGARGSPDAAHIEVVGEVQGGVFRPVWEWTPEKRYQIEMPLPRVFRQATKIGLVVRGESMDVFYPDGCTVVCVNPFMLGYQFATGDHVIVTQENKEGFLEATIKEFVQSGEKKWLIPRSTSPQFQTPVELPEQAPDDDNEFVKIVGLVIGSYHPRTPRRWLETA